MPNFTPAVFSVELGAAIAPAGTKTTPPVPYCSAATSAALQFEYRATRPVLGDLTATSAANGGANSAFEFDQGNIAIIDAVGASSAFAAGPNEQDYYAQLSKDYTILSSAILAVVSNVFDLLSRLQMFTSNHDGNDAFEVADARMKDIRQSWGGTLGLGQQQTLDDLAKDAVRGLADGGYTDDTGIAHAVASGATEIVSVLDVTPLMMNQDQFLHLFKDGTTVAPVSVTPQGFQIFEEGAADVKTALASFASLDLGKSKYLESITYGTLNLTSKANAPMSIAVGGKAIKLHMIIVKSSLLISAMPWQDFQVFSELAQEISLALGSPANRAVVRSNIVGGMFHVDDAAH